jgi:hypothetical protein
VGGAGDRVRRGDWAGRLAGTAATAKRMEIRDIRGEKGREEDA